MAEYIEREAVQEILKKHSVGTWRGIPCYPEEIKSAAKDVNELPTDDVAPVRRSYWEEYETRAFGGYHKKGDPYWIAKRFYRCENCRNGSAIKSNYCPSCGAKMDRGNVTHADQ